MGVDMGRSRKPEGTRSKDLYKSVIIKVPNELYDKIMNDGKPNDIILQMLKEKYKINC